MTVERQVFYEGKVQGVGFRYTVKQIALGYDVTGWVRNLPDGRVELQVKGEAGEIDGFLEAIATSQLKHHIKSWRDGGAASVEGGIAGFEIRH